MADEPSRDDTDPRASAETRRGRPRRHAPQPVPVSPPDPPDTTVPGSEPLPAEGVAGDGPVPQPPTPGGRRDSAGSGRRRSVPRRPRRRPRRRAGRRRDLLRAGRQRDVVGHEDRAAGPSPAPVRPSAEIAAPNDIAGIVAKAEPSIVAVTTDGGPRAGTVAPGPGSSSPPTATSPRTTTWSKAPPRSRCSSRRAASSTPPPSGATRRPTSRSSRPTPPGSRR